MNDDEITAQAVEYYRKNKKELIKKYADPFEYPPILNPSAFFMSGSPGAGKTEVANGLVEDALRNGEQLLHIDTDEVRGFFPGYSGGNSSLYQKAASMAVETILSSAFKNYQSFILDTNFAVYEKAIQNIENCIKQERKITILYIYQNPLDAWQFTQDREVIEGRKVTKDIFAQRFVNARETTTSIKSQYGPLVKLNVLINNAQDRKKQVVHYDVDSIDNVLKKKYTKEEISKIIE